VIETTAISLLLPHFPGAETGVEIPGVISGALRVDEGASPYTTAGVTLAIPPADMYAALDPQIYPRVILRADRREAAFSPYNGLLKSQFSQTLRVVARSIDAGSATMTLNLANDESFLDFAPAQDIDLQSFHTSIRRVIAETLRTALGLASNPTVAMTDSIYRQARTLRNLIPESSFEFPITQWKGVNATLSRSGSYAKEGGNSLRIAPSTAQRVDSYAETDVSLTPGKTYRLSAWGSTDYVTGQLVDPIYWRRAAIFTTINGTAIPIAVSPNSQIFTSTRPSLVTFEFTVPEGTRGTTIRLYNGTDTQTTGAVYWDAVQLVEAPFVDGATPVNYFDGNTPDDDLYVYVWDGDRAQSTSTRRARVERPSDTLVWRRGQTARDFLTPILQSAGVRLYQDTSGTWRAVDNAWLTPGRARIDLLDNLFQVTDQTSIDATHPDGSPLWADAVAITYNWLDGNGDRVEATDVSAPAGYRKLWSLVLDDTFYPGPGQAEYIRSRLAMRGRQMTAVARIDYNVQPSQELTLITEQAGRMTGVVDSVSFDLATDEMTVVGKRMVAAPATAWNQLAVGVRWADSPVGASWASETA
jgi:hypothetical protein